MRTFRPIADAVALLAATVLPIMLSACGGASPSSNAAATATASAATTPAGWTATDACAVMDKVAVAKAVGGTIKTATLGAVKAEGGGFPLYSQCEVLFEDGRMLVFGTSEGTNNESVADQVGDMRRQAKIVASTEPVDVAGLGKAALWVADLHQLYAFLGDRRFVSATLTQTDFRKKSDSVETVKAQEIAVLQTAGA